MSDDAPCTRCGSYIHHAKPVDTTEGMYLHVVCQGCSFEWVE